MSEMCDRATLAGCGDVPFARHKNHPLRDGYSDGSPCGQLEIVWLGLPISRHQRTPLQIRRRHCRWHELQAFARAASPAQYRSVESTTRIGRPPNHKYENALAILRLLRWYAVKWRGTHRFGKKTRSSTG